MHELAPIQIRGITIDPRKWKVSIDGVVVPLTSCQLRLLHLLASNAGRVLTRRQIIERIHGPDHEVTEHSVDVEVLALRKKLGSRRDVIQTKRGVGYYFDGQEHDGGACDTETVRRPNGTVRR
jgi:DNA-binding response OmpR family regulator